MSNAIRYDSLLVRYLAAELDERLRGRVLRALRLDAASRSALLVFRRATLHWDLHPTGGGVRWQEGGRLPEAAGGQVLEPVRGTVVSEVTAPPDERLLRIALEPPGTGEEDDDAGAARATSLACIVVELLTNQWNLLALDAQDRIVGVLQPREAHGRVLRPGARYTPPRPSGRAGAEAPLERSAWHALLDGVPAAERERTVLARVAYTSPINVRAILEAAARSDDDAAAVDAAYERYRALASLPSPAPHVLAAEAGAQPYPLPLPGVPGERAATLLDAIAKASAEAAPAAVPRAALERLERRIAALARRAERMEEERQRAGPHAAELRRQADLLLAQPGQVRKGMEHVELTDFEGGTVRVELDPALSPVENAHRLYAAARKRERAAARLPALIQEAERLRERLAALLERARAGTAEPAEIEAALGGTAGVGAKPGRKGGQRLAPYRRYRTSGGLEVRVGRNRHANDELTFHHSAPTDVWLHAREAAGSHVILRWADADANPPARDLTEAAVLAALHSRARTSGTVAVDWTRRRYVRKPRKAPPGLVVPERVKTLFVEPDPEVEKRLRAEEGAA